MSCASLISSLKVNAAEPSSQPNSRPINEQQRLARHVVSLNELTERRRTNRLFHNEQSPLYGERIEYTNIGKGNSSFVMRDMVLINRLPLVFARVYNSNSDDFDASLGDFGKGWRLNYNESITIKKNGDLLYFDESGSQHLIIQTGSNHFYPQYHFAQIQSVKPFGKQIQLTFNSGVIKSFDLIGNNYKLSQIKDAYSNHVDIAYHQGKIKQISNNQGQLITINRNQQGLITNIIDHHQRKIIFNYEKGLLKSNQDLAGNLWQYQYTNGLLHTITDPEQNQVVSFDYYHTGVNQKKTAKLTLSNQTFAFDYQGNTTTVTNQLQQQTQFEQNAQGVTVAVSNHQGLVTRLGLNDKLQLIKLLENDLTIAELIYDDNHQPQTLIKTGKAYELGFLDNNQHQQLHTIGKTHAKVNTKGKPTTFSTNGITRNYQYNHLGEVTEQREHTVNGKEILSEYLYDNRGLLEYLTVKGQTAHFKYNRFGQLERINFPNGAYHQYKYNDLGLRDKTIRSDGSTIDYTYDAAGVLLNLMQNDDKGNHQLKEMHYNHNNLATEYIVDGYMMLDIKYDDANNPTSISYNGNPVEYRYDQHNRLTTVIDGDQYLRYHYKNGESDIRIQQDQRSFISRLSKGRSNHNSVNINHAYTRTVDTPHQFVYFDPYLNQFKMPSFEQMVATDINHDASQRRRLYNAVSKQKTKQRDFDKPSNSLFFPPTYRGVHCDLDYCWELVEVFLSGPKTVTVDQPVTFTATPTIANMFDYNNHQCSLQHRFSVDGQIIEYNGSGLFNYTFGSPGAKKVEVRSNCQNCATWNFQYDSVDINANCKTPNPTSAQGTSIVQNIEEVANFDGVTNNLLWGSMGYYIAPEDTLDLTIQSYYHSSDNTWRFVISNAVSSHWLRWRLLPARPQFNLPEVFEATINSATASSCDFLIKDLTTRYADAIWYKLDAIEAHERVHVNQWKSIVNKEFTKLNKQIQLFKIEHTCDMTAEKAVESIKNSSNFNLLFQTTIADIKTAFGQLPHASPSTILAEREITCPLIQQINQKAITESVWPMICQQMPAECP